MIYIIDTSSLIDSYNIDYPAKYFPGVWEFLKNLHQEKRLFSIDEVKDEMKINEKKDDSGDIANWFHKNKLENFFISTKDENVLKNIKEIQDKIDSLNYTPRAITQFFDDADPYLIAYIMSQKDKEKHALVTQERSASDNKKKIQIPDVCKKFDVKYMRFQGMIRQEEPEFVLK